MRINLKTTPSQMCIPFNYQPKLVGTLHKWLGPNDIHGKLAMHSFSWLMGGSTTTNGIVFDNGARFLSVFMIPTGSGRLYGRFWRIRLCSKV